MKKIVGFFGIILTLAVTLSGCNNTNASSSSSEAGALTCTSDTQTSAESCTFVYIAASGKGTKYHYNPDCSNMQNVILISIDKAEEKGYEPCKKCYKQ